MNWNAVGGVARLIPDVVGHVDELLESIEPASAGLARDHTAEGDQR